MTKNINIESHAAIINEKIKHFRKNSGIFFTPQWVVDFMVDLINANNLNPDNLKILEPACGICQFLHGIKKNKAKIFSASSLKIGVEINQEVVDYIHNNQLKDNLQIIKHDFLLWETNENFDLIVGNPPYGIPSLSEHYTIKIDNETKKKYKELYETWYGKYNVYGAFIEKSIKLLKENGQLIFIVPATFMILDEFKKLRNFLADNGKTEIIYMGPGVFKPEADVTTVVLKFTKSNLNKNKLLLYDYEDRKLKLVIENNNWIGDIILFSTQFSKKVEKICNFKISDIYTVRISPRTPEIKHNPNIIKSQVCIEDDYLPILNGRNLKIGEVVYKPITGYWIKANKKTTLRKFFSKPHIVVGLGFRGNGQLGAAYDYKIYPWMGDVYHLLREYTLINKKFDLSEQEVVDFLNSEIIKKYIKDVFRNITYHLNITQLKQIPLPTKQGLKKIKEIML